MAAPTLTTTRYVEVGTYIGQFFVPGAGALANDVRVPCIVAKGDRLFIVKNTEMRRSFRFAEELTFSAVSPFVAPLDYNANGAQAAPVRLFTSTGQSVPTNKWQFLTNLSGEYDSVQILDTAFDPLAQYFFDYQTTSRTIPDPIPTVTIGPLSGVTAQIRDISSVGPFPDQPEYVEYVHFFDQFEVDAPAADINNAFLTRGFSAVNDTAVTGTGTVAVSTSASYLHPYSRVYKLKVLSASGVVGSRLATLEWDASPVSSGNSALPPTPINAAITKPTLLLDETNVLSMTSIPLELGVVLDFDFGASNYAVNDTFYLQANGAGLIELDPLLNNTNQYTEFTTIDDSLGVGSTGSLVISSLPSAYTFTAYNTSFRAQVVTVSGAIGSRVATFVWTMFGGASASGAFTVSELVPGSTTQVLTPTGITLSLSFGATHFTVGDRWDWSVKAPRSFYKGKETVRNVKISIATVVYLANQTRYTGSFLSDTPEGRFGTWAADTGVNNGRFETTDGLKFYVRNGYLSTLVNPVPGGSRNSVADDWTTQARSLSLLDFSLSEEVTSLVNNPAEINTDVTGAITGTVGAKYITAEHLPDTVISLRRVSNSTAVSFVQVPGTPFLRITSSSFGNADGDLTLVYRWSGAEPDPGQSYYLTGKYLRPIEMYEKPFLFLRPGDAARFLAPSTIRNDLYIGAQIAFDYAIPGLFVIQVRDADDDGVYSRDDYKRAINAFLEDPRATDLVVLNSFQNIGDQLNVINRANDPFERHEALTYIGCPIGTPIGSENENNSLVFYARRTLKVDGDSHAHGSRILHSATKAKRTITLEDGSSTQLTLDGSFVAAALAGLVASFSDPKETILFEQITGFDSIETYAKQENAILGGNNIIFFQDVGQGVVRIMEDVTTDDFSPDTLNLNQMTQKQFVTKDIRRTMTNAIIGQVFPSAGAGVALIEDILTTRLQALVSRGLIGQYQDADGIQRSINSSDVYVQRDQADPTLFHIGYNYFLATVAKRVFGLFTVSLPGGFPR